MSEEELKINIIKQLGYHKVRFRKISIENDTVHVGIDRRKSGNLNILKGLKSLNLIPISITYGNWVFRYTGL